MATHVGPQSDDDRGNLEHEDQEEYDADQDKEERQCVALHGTLAILSSAVTEKQVTCPGKRRI